MIEGGVVKFWEIKYEEDVASFKSWVVGFKIDWVVFSSKQKM